MRWFVDVFFIWLIIAAFFFIESWLIDWAKLYNRRRYQRTLANIRRIEDWHREHP